jgi:hypothetical protein
MTDDFENAVLDSAGQVLGMTGDELQGVIAERAEATGKSTEEIVWSLAELITN